MYRCGCTANATVHCTSNLERELGETCQLQRRSHAKRDPFSTAAAETEAEAEAVEAEEAEEATGNMLATSATEIPPRDFTIRRSLRNAFYRGGTRGGCIAEGESCFYRDSRGHSFISVRH